MNDYPRYQLPTEPRILVIRRDNIGDLVCTTPLISALRQRYPKALIDVLVNSYNAPVLAGHTDINQVHVYTKAKHRQDGRTLLGVYWRRLLLLLTLRRRGYDVAVVAGEHQIGRAVTLARQAGARHVLGLVNPDDEVGRRIDWPVRADAVSGRHVVERLAALAAALGADDGLVAPSVCMDAAMQRTIARRLSEQSVPGHTAMLAVHISARKPPQRWPASHFISLIRLLHQRYQARFLLFWSPGDEDNPLHPGDDRKAAEIMEAVADLPVLAYPTHQLEELIGGLSVCDAMICSDGGAMHLAAGLGKPIVCFFGNSDATVWHPWGVPYQLLQKPSQNVADISADEALAAFEALWPSVVPGSGRQASVDQK